MAKRNLYTIRGTAHWAKVLGDPVPNYGGDNREWTIDITPNEEGMQTLRELGLEKRIKNKGDERKDFIAFRQKEKRLDGSINRRISVEDSRGRPWPNNELIGNGSIVDLKFEKKDYGEGKQPGLYPQSIRVLKHEPYKRVEFAPLDPDDEFYEPESEDTFEEDFDVELPNETTDVADDQGKEFPE